MRKKLTLTAFILMLLTSVFGVANIGIAFYQMGYAAVPMFIIGGLFFFIPFIFMMIEFGTGFKGENSGLFAWQYLPFRNKFGEKKGFLIAIIGIMIWYASFVIWMFSKSLSMWIPLSFALFGDDITTKAVSIGTLTVGPISPPILGLMGIVVVFLTFFIVSLGANKLSKVSSIGGIAVIALNVILLFGGLIVFAINDFKLAQPLVEPGIINSLVESPNPAYHSLVPFLSFLVFAVFAYGGTEAIAGISDDLKNPKRDLKRGIIIAAIFIMLGYIIGFFMVGAIMPWSNFTINGNQPNALNALFIIMANLGQILGGGALAQGLVRFAGLGLFLSYIGAFITLTYAPLKQLMDGTPKEVWPAKLQKVNKQGIHINALLIQAIIVSIFLLVKSLLEIIDPQGASVLFNLLVNMTNVGMTLPYLFLIVAWYYYRQDSKLEKDIVMFKSKVGVASAAIISFIVVAFGNIFTIINPLIPNAEGAINLNTFIWTIVGPVIFAIFAVYLAYNYQKNKRKV